MGIDKQRFKNHDDLDDFICSICLDVVDLNMTTADCEHLFCKSCIESHLQRNGKTCPSCRQPFEPQNVARLIRKMIEKLEVSCQFNCGLFTKYEMLEHHEKTCIERTCTLKDGCNSKLYIDHTDLAGCIKNLKQLVRKHNIQNCNATICKQMCQFSSNRQDLQNDTQILQYTRELQFHTITDPDKIRIELRDYEKRDIIKYYIEHLPFDQKTKSTIIDNLNKNKVPPLFNNIKHNKQKLMKYKVKSSF